MDRGGEIPKCGQQSKDWTQISLKVKVGRVRISGTVAVASSSVSGYLVLRDAGKTGTTLNNEFSRWNPVWLASQCASDAKIVTSPFI